MHKDHQEGVVIFLCLIGRGLLPIVRSKGQFWLPSDADLELWWRVVCPKLSSKPYSVGIEIGFGHQWKPNGSSISSRIHFWYRPHTVPERELWWAKTTVCNTAELLDTTLTFTDSSTTSSFSRTMGALSFLLSVNNIIDLHLPFDSLSCMLWVLA